jgi:hypothetical protein
MGRWIALIALSCSFQYTEDESSRVVPGNYKSTRCLLKATCDVMLFRNSG